MLIFTLFPFGSTTFKSMDPANMSGGVSSVTGNDILKTEKKNK